MDTIVTLLLCFSVIVTIAIYWTVWKIRAELNQNLGNMASQLTEIRKSLEKKTGGA